MLHTSTITLTVGMPTSKGATMKRLYRRILKAERNDLMIRAILVFRAYQERTDHRIVTERFRDGRLAFQEMITERVSDCSTCVRERADLKTYGQTFGNGTHTCA